MTPKAAQRAIRAIREKAEEVGLPVYWKTDLERDAAYIAARRPARFAWIPYETGTYIFVLDPVTPEDVALARATLEYIAYRRPEAIGARPYVWDGHALREMDWKELEREVARLRAALER